MDPIRSLAEIPFIEREPWPLLNLQPGRDAPDPDFYQFGFGRVSDLILEQTEGDPELFATFDEVLVLALHSADEADPNSADIELEFFIDEVDLPDGSDYSVTTNLCRFLSVWLPRICRPDEPVVLALCNPHRILLPPYLRRAGLYYAEGNVLSWLDIQDDTAPELWPQGTSIRLVAPRWHA